MKTKKQFDCKLNVYIYKKKKKNAVKLLIALSTNFTETVCTVANIVS